MLALTGDVVVVAAGGVLTALVTAVLAFAGVIVSARTQKTPATVVAEPELTALRAEVANLELRLLEVAADRDVWRELAREWAPRPPAAD